MSTDLIIHVLQVLPFDGDALPNPTPTAPPGTLADKVTRVLGLVMWACAAVCIGAAIISGAKIAMAHRRGEESEGFKSLVMAMIGFIITLAAATILTWATT